MPKYFDLSGNEITEAVAHTRYGGFVYHPSGESPVALMRFMQRHMGLARARGPRWELTRVQEQQGPAVLKVKTLWRDGAPCSALVIMAYPDLNSVPTTLPDLTTGDPAIDQWTRNGLAQFSDQNTGLTGFGLGKDSWIRNLAAGGPYLAWVFDPYRGADCIERLGWVLGTDHRGLMDLTFQLVDGEPVPEQKPGCLAALWAVIRDHLPWRQRRAT